jgi:NTP pyrophosphatase (non-canonical NTP hydrolase)
MTDKTLSIFVAASYKTACDHGFHDKELSDDHYLCLIVSEMMEAVEADRKSKRAQRSMFEREAYTNQPEGKEADHWKFCFEQFIKDTVEDEFADVLIRIFDLIGTKYATEDLDFTGDSVTYSSGKTFTEKAAYFARRVLWSNGAMCQLVDCIRYIETWSHALGFDIIWHIENKMRYNAMRQTRHGKKY